MSAQCYEHRFGYCTNAKTCFNVHINGAILAERRVLLGAVPDVLAEARTAGDKQRKTVSYGNQHCRSVYWLIVVHKESLKTHSSSSCFAPLSQ